MLFGVREFEVSAIDDLIDGLFHQQIQMFCFTSGFLKQAVATLYEWLQTWQIKNTFRNNQEEWLEVSDVSDWYGRKTDVHSGYAVFFVFEAAFCLWKAPLAHPNPILVRSWPDPNFHHLLQAAQSTQPDCWWPSHWVYWFDLSRGRIDTATQTTSKMADSWTVQFDPHVCVTHVMCGGWTTAGDLFLWLSL